MRDFQGKAALVVGVLYVAFVGWSLWGAVRPIETYLFRIIHLAFILVLGFLTYSYSSRAPGWTRWLDLGLAVLSLISVGWALTDLNAFIRRSTLPEPVDIVFGILTVLLLLELSRRVVGIEFTAVVALFLLYTYLGNLIPGPLAHKGYTIERIIGHMYMTLEGILGVPLDVSVSFVLLFVVYGTFMDAAGAGQFWLDLALAMMGRKSSSAGRGTVITTALLGGPQGSGVATTMSVSPIMWPILQKAGYSRDMAAGLISAGGIGAVISPPLMGAAAFLIMQFLGVSFWDVVVMVTVPTLLYYAGSFFLVEIEARKYNFAPPEGIQKTVGRVMREHGYHLISLIVLVVMLALGRSPAASAMYGIGAVILTSFISRDRLEWLTPRRLLAATLESARNMLPVSVLLAAAGLIVGVFSLTGLGLKISGLIMSVSGGSVFLAVVLSLFTSIVIGLSLPITATYIMTVIMIAPALVRVGIPDYVAHLLVFYFAVLSEVSPPVGLSPSAAAAVTGGNPFRSMMQAWKYSLPAFLVPFFFSVTAEGRNLLIVNASPVGFTLALLTAMLSLFIVAPGIVGFFYDKLSVMERAALILSAAALIVFPVNMASLWWAVALLVAAGVLIRNYLLYRRLSQVPV